MQVDSYNYERFDVYVESGRELEEFSAFPNHLHARQPAPAFTAVRHAHEAQVDLSEVWAERTVVLEFGSFT